ncbi:5-methyltetrahydropteroyltriglutamate--homocysteine S-methyltransferase [Kribbella kalugense]|uniref:5-methyltetrahydropteroyltriglutamate--homocysteine methyltransferase n=1 Tax=Kribbella kalugense TaxID=2512221 RepID=A0A4R8A2C1_9ACTN|nr:5-methyltetrahydropteroyltriglutamate--homocysteine S-methyltransferase [Kribbella kalugense]TDW23761.1 methionine synthase (B12-independent) [Kribbella kalugense]
MNTTTTVLGYPRIGPRRELKHALEHYWADGDAAQLEAEARRLRAETWLDLKARGLDTIPGNTFSYYDQMLDQVHLLGVVPDRFRALGLSDLDTYFAMARGRDGVAPLELTKWFDTNYHYLVPELDRDTRFHLNPDKILTELTEAREHGVDLRPVVIGPLTFLLLSKSTSPDFEPLSLLNHLVDAYADLLAQLDAAGVDWVQLDEPALVQDRTPAELDALRRTYDKLATLTERPRLLVATYFGDPGPALPVLVSTPIDGVALDLVSAPGLVEQIAALPSLQRKTVVAGVVDGRNVWRTALGDALSTCATLSGSVGRLEISTSCSLLHIPYDVEVEDELDPRVRERLAFARQKVDEVVLLGRALSESIVVDAGNTAGRLINDEQAVRDRVAAIQTGDRQRAPYDERRTAQESIGLPKLATTTIGSFPQTVEIRRARADLRTGRIDQATYDERMRSEIAEVIARQEDIGLDVLVHGEPERNDMVQYFAEQLDGYATTKLGWVQSYGSRCVRPPILYGDVSRPNPMTVRWASYAQSLTSKPVKGMLTGPVTMLAWSFVRDDQPLQVTADQVALALRDEVADLVAAGIRIIQVDEPALRELLPLREADRKAYLDWSVGAFRLATGGAPAAVQVHTHLCYSEFGAVIAGIDGLDADVTTIEAARSRMEVLADLAAVGFRRGVGPGVYDIHSPRVPGTEELIALIQAALASTPADQLWINPDCGLKTRTYAEVDPALRNLTKATQQVRTTL